MPASSFDFDVITGPSMPREERDTPAPQQPQQAPPAEAGSAPPHAG